MQTLCMQYASPPRTVVAAAKGHHATYKMQGLLTKYLQSWTIPSEEEYLYTFYYLLFTYRYGQRAAGWGGIQRLGGGIGGSNAVCGDAPGVPPARNGAGPYSAAVVAALHSSGHHGCPPHFPFSSLQQSLEFQKYFVLDEGVLEFLNLFGLLNRVDLNLSNRWMIYNSEKIWKNDASSISLNFSRTNKKNKCRRGQLGSSRF